MFKEFKQFLLRGNVVDLAVGVVIGASFGTVVTALVKDFLTPLIAAIAKVPDFSGLFFTINGSKFAYGDFINALISFVLVATAVYFFVVVPMNALLARVKKGDEPTITTKPCPFCKTDIAKDATRCSACTSQLV